jgi:hypothetical protein
MKYKEKYIKEKFHSVISYDVILSIKIKNETNLYFINVDSEMRKHLSERNNSLVSNITVCGM